MLKQMWAVITVDVSAVPVLPTDRLGPGLQR